MSGLTSRDSHGHLRPPFGRADICGGVITQLTSVTTMPMTILRAFHSRPRTHERYVPMAPRFPGKAAPESHRWGKKNASRKGPKGIPDRAEKPGRGENRTATGPRAKKKGPNRQKQNNDQQKEQPARPVSGDEDAWCIGTRFCNVPHVCSLMAS
jgi:hypothetical protein